MKVPINRVDYNRILEAHIALVSFGSYANGLFHIFNLTIGSASGHSQSAYMPVI